LPVERTGSPHARGHFIHLTLDLAQNGVGTAACEPGVTRPGLALITGKGLFLEID
jgi:hypothetical protein